MFKDQANVTSFKWGDVAGWIDVKSGQDYEVQTGYKVFESATSAQPTMEVDGTTFKLKWGQDSAVGLGASIASAVALILCYF